MNASASHFAFSAVSGSDEPERDARGDRDQDPEPQLRVELAARTILRGRGGRRRHAHPLRSFSPGDATVTRSGMARCATMPAARRPRERLSAAQARRIALAAQGFADPRPGRRADRLGGAAAVRPRRPRPDRLGQRARARALPAAVRAQRPVRQGAARPRGALRPAAPVRVLGPRGLADPGRAAAGAALAHGARGRRRVGRHAADPARSAPTSSRRCSRRCATAGRSRRARCSSTSGPSGRARGGTGATSSARSSGCSGAGRSRRRAGAGSSASTTCPSGCSRPR